MSTITSIQILNRIGQPGAPGSLLPGELAYNQPATTAPADPVDALYVGNGTTVSMLVGAERQVELWGDQSITGTKTIDIADLKITGGGADYLLTTDGAGNLAWTNAPGGGLTQVATDGVTLSGVGTTASPLAVVPETVAVLTDGTTLSGNGTTGHPLAVVNYSVSVMTDGVTITGVGTSANPLLVQPRSVAVATGPSLTGNGTTGSPLAVAPNSVAVATNSTIIGNGTTASPLGVVAQSVAVATDGITITGTGLATNPLKAVNGTVAVVADGTTIAGSGVTASPLHVLPNSVPIATTGGTLTGNGTTASPLAVVANSVTVATNASLTGNGTTGSPLGLTVPVSLQNGGTGVITSSNTALLAALGAASVSSLSGYLQLSGGTLVGPLVLSGNATANLNPVSLQQMNSAVAAVSSYSTTAPTSPNLGALWFNPTTSVLQIWNGSGWDTVVPSPVVTGVTLSGDATGTG